MKSIQIHQVDDYEGEDNPDPHPQPRNTAVIMPLLSFPNIKRLELAPPFTFSLDDGTLDRLGAWSQLETLDLGLELKCDETPGLLGLLSFAQHCPSLRYLRIFADATLNVPTAADILRIRRRGISNNSLRRLKLDNSPIIKAVVFASENLLSLIFPGLESVETHRGLRALWAEVEQLVPNLVPNRAAEEEYWASDISFQSMV